MGKRKKTVDRATELYGWDLLQGDTVMGTLMYQDSGHDGTRCHFKPTKEFSKIRKLFQKELKLLNESNITEWETAYAEILALKLRLKSFSGGYDKEPEDIFVIHIDKNEAWFKEW